MEFRIVVNVLLSAVVINCSTVNGASLHCHFKDYFYMCNGELSFVENDYTVTQTTGTHLPEESDSRVVRLHLALQNLPFFPRNIEQFFPNLQAIELPYNSITDVSNSDLRPHQQLRWLCLQHNLITHLESDIFDGLPDLVSVAFNYNNLKHVGYDIRLSVRGWLFFQHNPCIDAMVSSEPEKFKFKFLLMAQCPPEAKNKQRIKL